MDILAYRWGLLIVLWKLQAYEQRLRAKSHVHKLLQRHWDWRRSPKDRRADDSSPTSSNSLSAYMNRYKFRCSLLATIGLAYSVRECVHLRRSKLVIGDVKIWLISFTTEEYLISDKRLTLKMLMVSICTTRLGVQNLYVMPTKFIYGLRANKNYLPYSISWLFFIIDMECVYCAVRAEYLNAV